MKKNQRVTDFKSKMSQNEKLTRMYVYNTIQTQQLPNPMAQIIGQANQQQLLQIFLQQQQLLQSVSRITINCLRSNK